jgi:hypothetical protein
MKKLLFSVMILLSGFVHAQSFVNPDTVCYQTAGSIYEIDPILGINFQWTVLAPGILVSGQGTNTIQVDWSNASPGLILNGITVTAIGQTCPVIPVNLNVFIYQPIVTIGAIGPFCSGDACVSLTASIPNGQFTGTGVLNNQFCPNISGNGTFPISYSVNSAGCTATTVINVTVKESVKLGLIEHS